MFVTIGDLFGSPKTSVKVTEWVKIQISKAHSCNYYKIPLSKLQNQYSQHGPHSFTWYDDADIMIGDRSRGRVIVSDATNPTCFCWCAINALLL